METKNFLEPVKTDLGFPRISRRFPGNTASTSAVTAHGILGLTPAYIE